MTRETRWAVAVLVSALLIQGCGSVGSKGSDSGGDAGAQLDEAADVPAADVPAADVPAADVPAADVPAADVPAADVPAAVDAGTDSGPTACSLTTAFGTPTRLADLDTASHEDGFSLATNGLTVYFSSSRAGGAGGFDLFSATRSAGDSFIDVAVLGGAVNTAADERGPRISADGLRIYFSLNTAAAPSTYHIQIATRIDVAAVFGAGQSLAGVNSTASESDAFLVADESAIYFASSRAGGLGSYDLYTATRGVSGSFGTPRALTEISSTEEDGSPVVSPDQLTIYFASRRAGAGARGDHDIWMAHRSTIADGFGAPENLTPLNGTGLDFPLLVSADGCAIYFGTNTMGAGGYDLYVARRAR